MLGDILALDLEESGFYTHLASPLLTHAEFSHMLKGLQMFENDVMWDSQRVELLQNIGTMW